MQQFHDCIVVDTKKPQYISYELQRKILAYPIFLKLKNGKVTIKGTGCANGRSHQNLISKEDISSLTMYIKGFMLSCMIGKKRRLGCSNC